jgi:hypothetical protein
LAPPGARSKQRQAADGSVLAAQLAKHLELSRRRIRQLVDENAIASLSYVRFDQHDSRVRYAHWLRNPEQRSGRTQADAEARRQSLQVTQPS